MLFVCSSRSQQLPHNIVWGEGGWKAKLHVGGQKKGSQWRNRGQKGECVNNFVADCPKHYSWNGLETKLHQESFITTFNLHYGYFRFIPVDKRQLLEHNDRWLRNFVVTCKNVPEIKKKLCNRSEGILLMQPKFTMFYRNPTCLGKPDHQNYD